MMMSYEIETGKQIVEKKGNGVVIQSPEKVQYQRNVTEVKKFTPTEEQSANSNHELGYRRPMNYSRRVSTAQASSRSLW